METSATRGFWALRDLPVAIWLVLLSVGALLHDVLPLPRWLLIHLLLLGAATHAIFVWSQFFANALLRDKTPADGRRNQNRRLLMLNIGTLIVFTGVLGRWWLLTAAGAALIGIAVLLHGANLYTRLRRSLPARFKTTVRYHVAAAAILPLGLTLGTLLERGVGPQAHAQTVLAHALLNILGWMGLTVAGTLLTLWPTMLRTRIAEGAVRESKIALPILTASTLLAAGGALFALLPVTVAGLAGYLLGLGVLGKAFVGALRTKAPTTFSTLSTLAAVLWWVGTLLALTLGLALSPDAVPAGRVFAAIVPYLAAGFGVQILLGALSYLVPVALRKGPGPVKAATAMLDRGATFRVALANLALLATVLPFPGLPRTLTAALFVGATAAFLPLLILSLRAHRRGVAAAAAERAARIPGASRPRPQPAPPARQPLRRALAALAIVVLALAVGLVLDPAPASAAGPGTLPAFLHTSPR